MESEALTVIVVLEWLSQALLAVRFAVQATSVLALQILRWAQCAGINSLVIRRILRSGSILVDQFEGLLIIILGIILNNWLALIRKLQFIRLNPIFIMTLVATRPRNIWIGADYKYRLVRKDFLKQMTYHCERWYFVRVKHVKVRSFPAEYLSRPDWGPPLKYFKFLLQTYKP